MSRRKIKMQFCKARYDRDQAWQAFSGQDVTPFRWSLRETKRWWRFVLKR
jgi:hypothetical protein